MQFEVVHGDSTEQRADALVNAANTDLRMGGGVAGALRDEAGEAILAYEGETLADVRVIAYRDESYHTMRRIAEELR